MTKGFLNAINIFILLSSLGGCCCYCIKSKYKTLFDDFIRQQPGINVIKDELDSSGNKSFYKISGHSFYTDDIEILKEYNTIRAFYNYSTSIPYWSLKVIISDKKRNFKEEYYCITQTPKLLMEKFNWNIKEINVEEGQNWLGHCKIVNEKDEYLNEGREMLEKKYFKNGSLKTEFRYLNENPNFIYALIENGFYVFDGCESGILGIN